MNPGPYHTPDPQPQPITPNSRNTLPNLNIPTASNPGNMFYSSNSGSSYPYPLQPTPTTEKSTPPLTHTSTTSDDKVSRGEEAARLLRFVSYEHDGGLPFVLQSFLPSLAGITCRITRKTLAMFSRHLFVLHKFNGAFRTTLWWTVFQYRSYVIRSYCLRELLTWPIAYIH